MTKCMRCGTAITDKNYVFSWTLMCKPCDKQYHKQQKKRQAEAQPAQETKPPSKD